jgi:hypothetical protein
MASKWVVALGFILAGTGTASHVAAEQQPTFPLLQDGSARTAFVSGAYRTCLERQRASAENASLSTPELGAFCLCYGRALADAVNGADYEALLAAQLTKSLQKKAQLAASICTARMNPSDQRSEREQEIVALRNQCVKEYHPEDTDAAAAIVRETFCSCFSETVAKSNTKPESRSEAIGYCSRQLRTK